MVILELPFPPSVNSIWKRGRQGSVYLSDQYKAWKKAADQTIMIARTKGNARVWGRFTAIITLDERRRYTKKGKIKRIDADNFTKATMDCLQRMRVIDDDSLADHVKAQWGKTDGARVELQEVA